MTRVLHNYLFNHYYFITPSLSLSLSLSLNGTQHTEAVFETYQRWQWNNGALLIIKLLTC